MQRFFLSKVRVKNALAETGDSLTMEQIKEMELLVALQDAQENFLGIGILGGTDVEEQVVKVYTPVSENVSTIMIGKVKVNKEGRELD